MRMASQWLAIAVLALAAQAGLAQEQRPASPSAESLEPAVDTSAREPAPTGAARTDEDDLEPAIDTSAAPGEAGDDAGASPRRDANASEAQNSRTGARSGRATDRIELDATQITGNRELPKVLYIVPWKRSDLGDLLGRPVNSLLDEVLTPVDRDVFKRETRYFSALESANASPGAAGETQAGDTAPPPAPR